jgi:hypothetical protein
VAVKWFLAGVLAAVLLGPGTFALRRGRHASHGRDTTGTRRWLGRTAAIVAAAAWLALLIALVLV